MNKVEKSWIFLGVLRIFMGLGFFWVPGSGQGQVVEFGWNFATGIPGFWGKFMDSDPISHPMGLWIFLDLEKAGK